jgi:hypothetical protein
MLDSEDVLVPGVNARTREMVLNSKFEKTGSHSSMMAALFAAA